jgi:excisionase family DNA binding protein
METFITVEEASRILKIKPATLYTWAYRRKIPSQKVGKALRFREKDLEVWLKTQARSVEGE